MSPPAPGLFRAAAMLLVASLPAAARAELRGGLAAGGTLELTQPAGGWWASADVYPFHLDGFGVDAFGAGDVLLIEAAYLRIVGDARPQLAAVFRAAAGADLRERGVSFAAGMGLRIGVGLPRPLAVVFRGDGHTVVWDGRFRLYLTATLGLALAW